VETETKTTAQEVEFWLRWTPSPSLAPSPGKEGFLP